jgi:hypothetical protein
MPVMSRRETARRRVRTATVWVAAGSAALTAAVAGLVHKAPGTTNTASAAAGSGAAQSTSTQSLSSSTSDDGYYDDGESLQPSTSAPAATTSAPATVSGGS